MGMFGSNARIRVVRRFVRDVRLHWILASPDEHRPVRLLPGIVVRPFGEHDRAALIADPRGDFASSPGYADRGATGHVLEFAGEIASIAHYVDRPRYTDGAIWPLRCEEMALVHIATRPALRCLGFASTLIAHATPPTLAHRADAAICSIGWNHRASLRAFRHAGWRTIGLSIELTRHDGRTVRLHLPMAWRRRARR